MAHGKMLLEMTYKGSTGEHTIKVWRSKDYTCELEKANGMVAACSCISYRSRHGRYQQDRAMGFTPVMPERFCKHQEMGIDAVNAKWAARKGA